MRRRAAKSSVQFSLFPFLAVLLCTMGSLIVLLLVLVQQARVEAEEQTVTAEQSQVDPAAEKQQRRQHESQREKLDQMAEQLDAMRAELYQRLASSRLNLSHLEDHIRRLREQLARMEADYQVLEQAHEQDSGSRYEQRTELQRLTEAIAEARHELEQAKRQAASKPRSYSIVPYDGPQGTKRRPIYLECRKDQLIIHPEGNVLATIDLQSSHAGNPLAAALRATREYLNDSGSLRGGEPYPLLLVRPDGTETYAAARGAMQSWSSEYGYELIDADMQLEFPPADEALGEVVRRTIRLARERQLALAHARTRAAGLRGVDGSGGPYAGSATPSGGGYLSASRNGGFEMRGSRDGADWLDNHVARPGQEPSDNNVGGGNNGGFYSTEQPGQDEARVANGNGPSQATGASGGEAGVGANSQQQGTTAAGEAAGGASAGNGRFLPSGSGPTASPFGGSAADTSSEQGSPASQSVAPIAASRGGDWALPQTARGATPFRRPIRVQVQADKLIVLPDRNSGSQTRVTQLNGPMQHSIDHFVAQLWEHMNSWGIAGPQAYWKPILAVEVARGGQSRFAELSALMQQSGVEVEWKR